MKKGILVLLLTVFFVSGQSYAGEAQELAIQQYGTEAYKKLCEAYQRGEENKTVDRQPDRETGKDEKYCSPVEKCADVCCERYFKMTWFACSLFLIRDGIILGFL
jgi:hypothetical protein